MSNLSKTKSTDEQGVHEMNFIALWFGEGETIFTSTAVEKLIYIFWCFTKHRYIYSIGDS